MRLSLYKLAALDLDQADFKDDFAPGTQELDAFIDHMIGKLKGWKSGPRNYYPNNFTDVGEVWDLAAVLAGTKRSGWARAVPPKQMPLVQRMLQRMQSGDPNVVKGLTYQWLPGKNKVQGLIIGKEQDIRRLSELLKQNNYTDHNAPLDWHHQMGDVLGYDPSAKADMRNLYMLTTPTREKKTMPLDFYQPDKAASVITTP